MRILFIDSEELKDRISIALFLVFLITFIGYTVSAIQIPSRYDEIEYLWRAQALLDGNIEISPQHHYFFSVILSIGLFIFGNKLIVAQVLSALIGALVVIPSYLLAQELFKNNAYYREIGLGTAMISAIALMPFSIEIRNDSLFLFFFLFSCYFMVAGISNPEKFPYAGVFAGFALLTRDPGLLIIPVLVAYFFLNSKQGNLERPRILSWIKRLLNPHLILTVLLSLVVASPRLIWRWYLFGSPLYTRDKKFWVDNYEDKFNTHSFVPQFEFQPSMRSYIASHTLQQMINRWLLGIYNILAKLQSQLTILILGFALIGLFIFRNRRYWIIHLNLGLWIAFFAWLFGIKSVTRFIMPIYPFIIMSAVAVGMKVLIHMLEWRNRHFLRFLRFKEPSKKLISHLVLFFMVFAFLPLFTIRTGQVYEQSLPSQNYHTLMEMVDWVNENTPEDALFMTRDGHDLIFYYTHRNYIITPNGDLDFILYAIDLLGIDYLIIDSGTLPLRPHLTDIFTEKNLPDGFSLVYWSHTNGFSNTSSNFEIKIFAIEKAEKASSNESL